MKKIFIYLSLFFFMSLSCANAVLVDPSRNVYGAWFSTDWILPGGHRYSEEQVRKIVKTNMKILSEQGINTLFLETYLRGYSIADVSGADVDYPMYGHLKWNFRKDGRFGIDTLHIFIEEANKYDIEVHAWVHVCYWKMDNTEIVLPWHFGNTSWNDLLVAYLDREYSRLQYSADKNVLSAISEARDLFKESYDDFKLKKILDNYGFKGTNRPLGALVSSISGSGGSLPDFLLVAGGREPFPPAFGKQLCSIYLNPEHPEVKKRIVGYVQALIKTHPGLSGIHLDHIRYTTDYQGFPEKFQKPQWDTIYFNADNPDMMKDYSAYMSILTKRRATITDIVNAVADVAGKRMAVSAAVLPAFPMIEDRLYINKNDVAAQDWYHWKVDFVSPMMYGYEAWRIRNMMRKWRMNLDNMAGGPSSIEIYPGVSHLQKTLIGRIDSDNWLFFNLSLSRDLRFQKIQSDDQIKIED